jgi:heme exporter protein C
MQLVGFSFFLMTLAVLVIGFREAIFLVPADAKQGDLGRTFYYHVPHSMWSLLFPYVNFLASLAFLYWRHRDPLKALTADALAIASAEITVLYATICLVTGSIWGKAAWGIWWAWDARITSMLLLWLLYVAYLVTRKLSATGQTSTLGAVLSIFAAIDVPIVYMSISWWRTQHPAPVFFGGPDAGLDKSMMPAFVWNILGWGMWGIFIMMFRFFLERRRQIAEQDAALSALESSMELTQ